MLQKKRKRMGLEIRVDSGIYTLVLDDIMKIFKKNKKYPLGSSHNVEKEENIKILRNQPEAIKSYID